MVSPFCRQAWVLSAVWANMVGQGMLLSFTSCLLPALRDPESPIKADLHTASWIASSMGLTCVPGFFLSSFLMDAYGRKLTNLIVIIPGTVAWVTVYLAQDIPTLLIGRLLGGLTAGSTVSLGAIVIGEYSNPKYRGVFLNLKTVSVCLGGMLVHILGHFLNWRTIALLGAIPHIVAIVVIFTWIESPAWLASKGDFDNAKKSFFWLREKSEASKKELDELIKAQMERLSTPKIKMGITDNMLSFMKKLTRRDFYKPVLIVSVSTALLEASGRHIFPAYALQIISELSGDKSQLFYYTLAIDIIITASAVSSSILVKIMKRRMLLFSTGFAAFAVLMIACIYLALTTNTDRPWIPMSIFVVFFILANLGCTAIPLTLLGEVFPLAHRGIGSAVAGICMSVNFVAIMKMTPYLLVHLKVHGMFFIYGIVMGLSLLILYFVLPETKDKTLQEIEEYFNNGRYRDETKDQFEEVKVKMIKK